MDYILYIKMAIAIILAMFCIYKGFAANVEDDEYLELMSYTVWQSGRLIRKEMMKLKRGYISGPRFYQVMSNLEDQGMIERRIREEYIFEETFQITEFRKKSSGIKNPKNKKHLISKSAVTTAHFQPSQP